LLNVFLIIFGISPCHTKNKHMKNYLLIIALLFMAGFGCNAQTASLWASATQGGVYGYGTILKADSTGTNFTVVHNFTVPTDSTYPDGSYPVGKMAVADNGVIYCVTELGGFGGSCTICTYNPITDSFSMVWQFAANPQFGDVPVSGIIKAGNGWLYGTTPTGGANNAGVIYSVDPATNTYTDIFDFPGDSLSSSMGPFTELLQANDGNLYGIVAESGLLNDSGVLFSFNPVNYQYKALYSLGSASGGGYRTPALVQAPDNKIYGVFAEAEIVNGASDVGMLFSYDIATNQFTDLHDLTTIDGMPTGGLLIANGNVYGETYGDTDNNSGEIYAYNIANSTLSPLGYFTQSIGYYPVGGLGMLGGDQLTGSCMQGGLYNYGTLFTFNLSNNSFTTLLNFDGDILGEAPQCDILETNFTATNIVPVVALQPMIYPNPATGSLYVQNAAPNTPYTIINTLGQVVDRGILTGNLQQIDLQQLSSGMYLINNVRFIKQ
jgi:uncharacterized repeat protein (TIGR03803 family)